MPSKEWDNIRLADVAGRDAARVPDGKLCSAGIERYAGLDLPSEQWPATKLTGTAFTYRATIPHLGSFRFYATRPGYSPARPLRWADLEQFLSVPSPPLVNGAYEFQVRLPRDRVGRHLIYTVWQNTDTPDTYYSCTDVEIAPAAPATTRPQAATPAPSTPESTPEGTLNSTPESSTPRPVPVASATGEPPSATTRLGLSAGAAALGGLVVLGGFLLWRKRIL